MLGDLRMPAPTAFGEAHDPLDPRLRLARVALEEIVDDGSGFGADRR